MPDLSRLSDAERRALLLLAHGHTAKTAAVELGVSEGSINERLREARRKAGVGSSRQLARIVAAEAQVGKDKAAPQENRDRKIGMAAPATQDQGRRRDLTPWAVWPVIAGAMTMIALAASIGAFVALAVARQPAPPAPSGTVAARAVRAATPSRPRVVAVSPMPGAVVPAGRLALTVTFDQPMQAGWSFVARDPTTYPACERAPRQSADRRSFTLACTVEAGREYEVGFNSDRHRNFASETGAPAIPAMVRFKAR